MRLLVLFLVCSIGLTYAADSYAQKALISIDVRNQRVEDILKEIEEQSDFDFFFNNKHVDLNRRVSISVDRSNIFSVLKEVFAGTNVRYSVLDKKIILSVEVQSPQQEKKGRAFMNVGYVRCSTVEQNEERQLRMMAEQGIDAKHIYTDKASGKNTDRPAFHKMMNYVREGDTVIVESISRIARNTRDLLGIVEQLTAKGVEFVSIKESIDTTTPQGKFMLTVFGALAELERENILERQREGIAIAKEQGKYKGRKPIDADPEQLAAVCARWRAGEITARAAMQEVGMKPNTFYRRVKDAGL